MLQKCKQKTLGDSTGHSEGYRKDDQKLSSHMGGDRKNSEWLHRSL